MDRIFDMFRQAPGRNPPVDIRIEPNDEFENDLNDELLPMDPNVGNERNGELQKNPNTESILNKIHVTDSEINDHMNAKLQSIKQIMGQIDKKRKENAITGNFTKIKTTIPDNIANDMLFLSCARDKSDAMTFDVSKMEPKYENLERNNLESLINEHGPAKAYELLKNDANVNAKTKKTEQTEQTQVIDEKYYKSASTDDDIYQLNNTYQIMLDNTALMDIVANVDKMVDHKTNTILGKLMYLNSILNEIDDKIYTIKTDNNMVQCINSADIINTLNINKENILQSIKNIKKCDLFLNIFETVYKTSVLQNITKNKKYIQSEDNACCCCYVAEPNCVFVGCGHVFCEKCILKGKRQSNEMGEFIFEQNLMVMREERHANGGLGTKTRKCYICKSESEYIKINSFSIESILDECDRFLGLSDGKNHMNNGFNLTCTTGESDYDKNETVGKICNNQKKLIYDEIRCLVSYISFLLRQLPSQISQFHAENAFEINNFLSVFVSSMQLDADEEPSEEETCKKTETYNETETHATGVPPTHPLYNLIGIKTRSAKFETKLVATHANQDTPKRETYIQKINSNCDTSKILDGIKNIINKYKNVYDYNNIVCITLSNVHRLTDAYKKLSKEKPNPIIINLNDEIEGVYIEMEGKNWCHINASNPGKLDILNADIDSIHNVFEKYNNDADLVLQGELYKRLKVELGILKKCALQSSSSTNCSLCQTNTATHFYNPCGHIICDKCKNENMCVVCYEKCQSVKKIFF